MKPEEIEEIAREIWPYDEPVLYSASDFVADSVRLIAEIQKRQISEYVIRQTTDINHEWYKYCTGIQNLPVGTKLFRIPPAEDGCVVPEGRQLVPKEATPEMLEHLFGGMYCANALMDVKFRRHQRLYSSMLAAAPEPPK